MQRGKLMPNVTIENELKLIFTEKDQHSVFWNILRNNYFIQPHCNRITSDYYFDYKNFFYDNDITLRIRRGNKVFINYKEPFDVSASLMSRYEYKEFLNIGQCENISTTMMLDNCFGNRILARYFLEEKRKVTITCVLVTKRIVFSIHSKVQNKIGDRAPIAVTFLDKVYDENGNFLFEEVEFETIDGYYAPQTYWELDGLKKQFAEEGIKESRCSKYQRYIKMQL